MISLDAQSRQQFLSLLVMSAAEPLIERRWTVFGTRVMRKTKLLLAAVALYERGAILSRVMEWDLEAVALLCAQPGLEDTFGAYSRQQVTKRLAAYERLSQIAEPDTFTDLVLDVELRELGPMSQYPEKLDARAATFELMTFLVEGLTFGALYAVQTERILRRTYEQPSLAMERRVANGLAYGLRLPDRLQAVAVSELDQRMLEVAASLARFVSEELTEYFQARLTRLSGHTGKP